MSRAPRWFMLPWVAVSIMVGIVAFTATAGLTSSMVAAAAGGALASGIAAVVLRNPLTANPLLAGAPRAMRRLFALGVALVIAQMLLTATFIIDPELVTWEPRPWTPQRSNHSCVSSYWIALERIGDTPDVYSEEIYSVPQRDPTVPRVARPIGPLLIDQYEYPPPFLVAPRIIAAATDDFWGFRRVWFALNTAIVLVGVILIAARFDRALGTHALWLTPFVLLAPAVVITLVVGNVQLAVIAASMIAMLLFERGRHAAGGAVLAYAIVSKLYPGLLLLFLLLRRDWRAAAWTAFFSIAILAISIADVGIEPYVAFARHMPKLLSGEAFPAFRNPAAIAVNESIPGLAFKLKLLGVPHMGFAASKALGWIYTLVAVALTARLALRPIAAGREPLVWITILILATMRSPFLPTYAVFPSLWLATLLAALTWGRSVRFFLCIAAWVALAFTFGTGAVPPVLNAIWTFVHTVAAFFLVVVALRYKRPTEIRGGTAPPPGA